MDISLNKLFNDALDGIPLQDKQAYLEAVQNAPVLVMNETDPVEFISYANMNIWEGVSLLVKYWYWKKELFGERMLLPLHDISGAGALDADDLETLRTGFLARVPNDNAGNSVIMFDRRRLNYDFGMGDTNKTLRMFFYTAASVTKEHDFATSNRTLVCVNLVPGFPNNKRNLVKQLPYVLECIPVRVKAIHSIFITRIPFLGFFIKLVIPAVEKNVTEYLNLLGTRITFDLVLTPDNAKAKLEEYGFRCDGLPQSFGGTWDYSTHIETLERKGFNSKSRQVSDVAISFNSELEFGGCTNTTTVYGGGGFVDPCRTSNVVLQVPTNAIQAVNNNHTMPLTNIFYNTAIEIIPTTSSQLLAGNVTLVQPNGAAGMQRQGLVSPPAHHQAISTSPSTEVSSLLSIDQSSFQIHYLRYNNQDPLRAAIQISSYNTIRQKLFAERSILPVNQTGYGALNDEDVATLNTGFMMILPNDKSGNFVITLEPCKVEGRSSESQRRCFFYILSVLFEQLTTTTNKKLVVLALMNNINTNNINQVASFSDIGSCFPIELAYLHVFWQPMGLGWFSYQSTAEPVLKTLLDVPSERMITHTMKNNDKLDESFLVIYNMDIKKLPTCLGGKWTIDKFRTWQQSRLQIENSVLPPTINVSPVVNVCSPTDQSIVENMGVSTPACTTASTSIIKQYQPILFEEPLLIPENGNQQTNSVGDISLQQFFEAQPDISRCDDNYLDSDNVLDILLDECNLDNESTCFSVNTHLFDDDDVSMDRREDNCTGTYVTMH